MRLLHPRQQAGRVPACGLQPLSERHLEWHRLLGHWPGGLTSPTWPRACSGAIYAGVPKIIVGVETSMWLPHQAVVFRL